MQIILKKFICGVIFAFALTSCSTNQTVETVQTSPTVADPKIVAECALLNEAMVRGAAISGAQDTQIVRGCPGYENIPDTSNRFSGAGQFLNASSAQVPATALSKGRMGKILFQRMISRGVPANVATEMVETEVFDLAVAAYN